MFFAKMKSFCSKNLSLLPFRVQLNTRSDVSASQKSWPGFLLPSASTGTCPEGPFREMDCPKANPTKQKQRYTLSQSSPLNAFATHLPKHQGHYKEWVGAKKKTEI